MYRGCSSHWLSIEMCRNRSQLPALHGRNCDLLPQQSSNVQELQLSGRLACLGSSASVLNSEGEQGRSSRGDSLFWTLWDDRQQGKRAPSPEPDKVSAYLVMLECGPQPDLERCTQGALPPLYKTRAPC